MKRHPIALAVLTVALAAAGCTFNVNNPEIKDNNLSLNTGDQQKAVNLSGAWLFIQASERFDVNLTQKADSTLTGVASQEGKRVGSLEGSFDGSKVTLTLVKDDATVVALNGTYNPERDEFGSSGFLALRQ